MKRYKSLFLIFFLYSAIGLAAIGLFFRIFRNILPPPEIGENKIVGYSQYFGYPIYADVLTYFAIVLLPLIAGFLAIFTQRLLYRKEKNGKKS